MKKIYSAGLILLACASTLRPSEEIKKKADSQMVIKPMPRKDRPEKTPAVTEKQKPHSHQITPSPLKKKDEPKPTHTPTPNIPQAAAQPPSSSETHPSQPPFDPQKSTTPMGGSYYGAPASPLPTASAQKAKTTPPATAENVSAKLPDTSESVRKLHAQPTAGAEIAKLLEKQVASIQNLSSSEIEKAKATISQQIASQDQELARINTAMGEIKKTPSRSNELPTDQKAKEIATAIKEHLKNLQNALNKK